MGSWRILVDVALPIPLVLVFLLIVPAPRWFTRGVVTLVQRTLGLEFFHTFRLLHVMLFISAMAFLGATRNVYSMYSDRAAEAPQYDTPNAVMLSLGKRWRSERNFWISFFNFTMWIVLARVYQIVKSLKQKEQEVSALKASQQGVPPVQQKPSSRETLRTEVGRPEHVDSLKVE